MPNAHLYLFSDGCPSDWLIAGQDATWHTIANVVFQSDPALQPQVDSGKSHIEILEQDNLFNNLMADLQANLPSGQLGKWKTGPSYKSRFCQAFAAAQPKHKLMVSACSFQEKTLRASKPALLRAYNTLIGGIEGRGIDFESYADYKGRPCLKHSFINQNGYFEIDGLENQMLVLLFMSWFVADQYVFFKKSMVGDGRHGFDRLGITVISDKLSGDNDFHSKSEQNLRNLIDPDQEGIPIVLSRSPQSDTFSGDLLADNLAGWLNAAINDPTGKFARQAMDIGSFGVWRGWHILAESTSTLESVPALTWLMSSNANA